MNTVENGIVDIEVLIAIENLKRSTDGRVVDDAGRGFSLGCSCQHIKQTVVSNIHSPFNATMVASMSVLFLFCWKPSVSL